VNVFHCCVNAQQWSQIKLSSHVWSGIWNFEQKNICRRQISLEVSSEDTTPLWPLLVYGAIVIGLVIAMLGLSYVLGQRHKEHATNEPYEGGILSTGSARLRFSSQFYLIAMLFVIFDVETIFIFSWAIAFKELGWFGYVGVSVFVILLFVVLIYEWRNGALDFGPDGKKILKAYRKRIAKNKSHEVVVK
jgi:NADH-quinone oxidoreductase subunit A